MTLQIYNTLTRRKEAFEPADPDRVTMYVCGPTVYNHPHIGNARPAVIFDVMHRLLKRLYPNVIYASNITDVEDKIIAAAKAEGVPIDVITNRYADIYREDVRALGVIDPDLIPRVTETIPEIVDMIGRLIEAGNAYEAEGHVLFNVPSDGNYGALSNRSRDEMIAGARVDVAPYKKDPADFVLWKPSDDTMPGWDSPWGRGRPGWHIECSAMVEKHLGETIDIHGGGQDLIFPHHENELAQSTCAHGGKPFARYWMHNGMLRVEGQKMSKSVGNVLLIHDLLEHEPAEAVRLLLLTGHYRHPLDFSEAGLEQAKKNLDRIYGLLEADTGIADDDHPDVAAVRAALMDDLNTPKALAEIFRIAKDVDQGETDPSVLKAACWYLGVGQQDPAAWLQTAGGSAEIDPDVVEELIQDRQFARKRKDFAEADRIRDELTAMGVVLEDGPGGTTWRAA
ncbi:MAG: cysteine--tRNA ligase [Minwuia sp.]|uniref:cysteine--tRNA ligase n=1 Tax=Minwuia sp. TaxID=2493630 RepID=UPI003A836EEA